MSIAAAANILVENKVHQQYNIEREKKRTFVVNLKYYFEINSNTNNKQTE